MSLQVLTKNPKLCCPTPLECSGGFVIERGGTIWESYVPVKGTFTFDGSSNSTSATIRIHLFNGKVITRNLQPEQSFAFTGDNVKKIEAFVSEIPSNILFRHCAQELIDLNCKLRNKCCPQSLQCELPVTYRNIPTGEDFLLWQSTLPVRGFLEINLFSFAGGSVKIIIKRFNNPDLVKTITQNTVIHASDMKALLVHIPRNLADPPDISVQYCIRDQLNKKIAF
ncbi:MAG: hypothetical protein GX272_08020 [Epulopiscium sp.]|jgi:hypothetical protein|nr:hypothetical protein [Candidatus Epulonipiscium sp.]